MKIFALNRILTLAGQPTLLEHEMQAILDFQPTIEYGEEEENLETFTYLYELEYKRSMLLDRPFQGNLERKENIIHIIEQKTKEVIVTIAESLQSVFKNWLDNHALLSAKSWAKQRVESNNEYDYYIDSDDPQPMLFDVISEYARYKEKPKTRILNYTPYLRHILSKIVSNINNYPVFKEFLTEFILPDRKEMMHNDLAEGLEEFNEQYGQEFKTETEAEEWIENAKIEDYLDYDIFYEESVEGVANMLKYYHDWPSLLIELNEKFVFPLWFNYWAAQGIEGTRKNIENIYKKLKSIHHAMPLENQHTIINQAIQATHQTGDMMDYYEEEYGMSSYDLEDLSNLDTTEWNQELRMIGVRIE